MAQTDPHGFTLTMISVGVVFAALIILYFVYSLSGKIMSGELKSKAKSIGRKVSGAPSPEVAAAIALALDMENGGETYAAIATAVHLYLSDTVHDAEPGIVTIVRREGAWDNKAMGFRKKPLR